MNELRQKVRELMAIIFEVDESEIGENTTPDDIENWDSLRHMNLVLALEEEFNIRFADEVLEQMLSLKLIELIVKETIEDQN